MKYIHEHNALEMFDQYLDENNGLLYVNTYSFLPSRVLQLCDPVAYREEFLAWLNALDLTTEPDEADEVNY